MNAQNPKFRFVLSAALASVLLTVGWSRAGDPFTNSIGMKLVPIAPGSFQMGQDGPAATYLPPITEESDRTSDWDEKRVHPVTITRPFHMGATEVTNKQLEECFPGRREKSKGFGELTRGDDDAALGVSWEEAVEFCEWLSKKEGKPYRLPTEAEWEYACRAGTTTPFNTGDSLPPGTLALGKGQYTFQMGFWFPGKETTPPAYRYEDPISLKVAAGKPNPWGLYDMHGNVEEWCSDWYGPYPGQPASDPAGPLAGDFRVTRGGAHSLFGQLARSANRSNMLPWAKVATIGFRVVQTEPSQASSGKVEPPLNARNVGQEPSPWKPKVDMAKPYFNGPRPFVKVPPGSVGPMFSKHNHYPSITPLANGDLFAAWYSCVKEPGAELAVLASRLRAGAEEWDMASPFWDTADRNDHGTGVWWDGEKTLYHFNGDYSLRGAIVRTSLDNGATWSPAKPFCSQVQVGHSMFRTKDGTIMVSSDWRAASGLLIASADGGKTWKELSTAATKTPPAPGETGTGIAGGHAVAIELKDGRLLGLGRHDGFDRQKAFEFKPPQSISTDGGRTWTYSVGPFPVISSAQRMALVRLKEGPILAATFTEQMMKKDDYGNILGVKKAEERTGWKLRDEEGREFTGHGMVVAVSYDEGKTWPVARLVSGSKEKKGNLASIDNGICKYSATEAEPTGYLAACVSPDGMIHLISSMNHYAFNLAWVEETESPAKQSSQLKQMNPIPCSFSMTLCGLFAVVAQAADAPVGITRSVIHSGKTVEARILIDRGIVESFWNGGEAAYSAGSLLTGDGPAFALGGDAVVEELVVYPVTNIWK